MKRAIRSLFTIGCGVSVAVAVAYVLNKMGF